MRTLSKKDDFANTRPPPPPKDNCLLATPEQGNLTYSAVDPNIKKQEKKTFKSTIESAKQTLKTIDKDGQMTEAAKAAAIKQLRKYLVSKGKSKIVSDEPHLTTEEITALGNEGRKDAVKFGSMVLQQLMKKAV